MTFMLHLQMQLKKIISLGDRHNSSRKILAVFLISAQDHLRKKQHNRKLPKRKVI